MQRLPSSRPAADVDRVHRHAASIIHRTVRTGGRRGTADLISRSPACRKMQRRPSRARNRERRRRLTAPAQYCGDPHCRRSCRLTSYTKFSGSLEVKLPNAAASLTSRAFFCACRSYYLPAVVVQLLLLAETASQNFGFSCFCTRLPTSSSQCSTCSDDITYSATSFRSFTSLV